MAEHFNNAFRDKVKKLRDKVQNVTETVAPEERLRSWIQRKGVQVPEFKLKTITKEQLEKYLKKLKGSKCYGIDMIDSYSLQLAAPHIIDILQHLVNLSIGSGTFGSIWKVQLIYPFHKKASKTDPMNYRPVSHISEVSKLVEYAVFDQLMEHFVSNNLFHNNHHSFIPNHNTVTAFAQLHDIWLEASRNKEMTAALLLDLSAAFDLIPHSILLKKLKF